MEGGVGSSSPHVAFMGKGSPLMVWFWFWFWLGVVGGLVFFLIFFFFFRGLHSLQNPMTLSGFLNPSFLFSPSIYLTLFLPFSLFLFLSPTGPPDPLSSPKVVFWKSLSLLRECFERLFFFFLPSFFSLNLPFFFFHRIETPFGPANVLCTSDEENVLSLSLSLFLFLSLISLPTVTNMWRNHP